tara:strand:+ start:1260 stop:2174 length:915 start_codon:yes stop_codon:yes gene_type:complete
MKKYLVTGAAGFVGSALAKKLLKYDNKVVTIDNLSTGNIKNIPEGVEFIEGNVQDRKIISSLENYKFDCIFHIAGQSSGEISFEDPIYDLQTNTQSTLLLIELAKKINCKKIIYASTMSVYGDVNEIGSEEDFTEPKSFYGIGKLASEKYLKINSDILNCTVLRLFNIYGPGQNMNNMKQGMVSIFLQQALKSDQILVKGSLNRFRDFIYIDDVISAFIKAEKNNAVGFKIYNIGTGIKTTVSDLLNIICSNFHERKSIIQQSNTPGDQFGIIANIDNAEKGLNWKPSYKLKDGLKKMIKYYKL